MENKKKETIPASIARVFLTVIKDRRTSPGRIATLIFGHSGKLQTRSFKKSVSGANKLLKERGLGLIVSDRPHGRIATMWLASPDDQFFTEQEVLRGKRRVESAARSFVGTVAVVRKLRLLPPTHLKQLATDAGVRALGAHFLEDCL